MPVYVVMPMVRANQMFFGCKSDAPIGLLGGKVIGLPPVLNFGSEQLKARIVPEVLDGKKFICLAISEAHAGSDVMGLQTTAIKTEDGKHWIVNG